MCRGYAVAPRLERVKIVGSMKNGSGKRVPVSGSHRELANPFVRFISILLRSDVNMSKLCIIDFIYI